MTSGFFISTNDNLQYCHKKGRTEKSYRLFFLRVALKLNTYYNGDSSRQSSQQVFDEEDRAALCWCFTTGLRLCNLQRLTHLRSPKFCWSQSRSGTVKATRVLGPVVELESRVPHKTVRFLGTNALFVSEYIHKMVDGKFRDLGN